MRYANLEECLPVVMFADIVRASTGAISSAEVFRIRD